MNQKLKLTLYLGYFIGITVFFMYYLFPSDKVKTYIESMINERNLNIQIQIQRLDLRFPFGVTFYGLNLFKEGNLFYEFDKINIAADLFSFFSKSRKIYVKGISYGGNTSIIFVVKGNVTQPQLSCDVMLHDLRIGDIPFIKSIPNFSLSGILSGNVTFYVDFLTKEAKKEARAEIYIQSPQIQVNLPVLQEKVFDFFQIDINLNLIDDNKMNMKKCVFKGTQFDGYTSGNFILKQPIQKSDVNISGQLQIHDKFWEELNQVFPMDEIYKSGLRKHQIPFRLKGEIDNPDISFR
ncbi:MAG: type II secretion system protein GspN [Desulfobacterales bacterium]|nr:type II secretion system protein GspN [Desulfobacterales bacterium]